MKLIITRHGETVENKEGILQGQLHGKLSDMGIEQARKLALKLKEEKIDAIYSSDLARAADTAKEIAKYHPSAKLFFVEELREKNQGSLTGRKISEIDWKNKPGDVESKEAMKSRANKILKSAFKEFSKGAVIFVGHGGINTRIMEIIFEENGQDIKNIPDFDNASISIIEVKDNAHLVISLNSVEHLNDEK